MASESASWEETSASWAAPAPAEPWTWPYCTPWTVCNSSYQYEAVHALHRPAAYAYGRPSSYAAPYDDAPTHTRNRADDYAYNTTYGVYEYETAAPTPFRDRGCRNLTRCDCPRPPGAVKRP
jgi:hypothetical protein